MVEETVLSFLKTFTRESLSYVHCELQVNYRSWPIRNLTDAWS